MKLIHALPLCQIVHMLYIAPGNAGPNRPQADIYDYYYIYETSTFIDKYSVYVNAQKIETEHQPYSKSIEKLDDKQDPYYPYSKKDQGKGETCQ